jgi:hypothetical protein
VTTPPEAKAASSEYFDRKGKAVASKHFRAAKDRATGAASANARIAVAASRLRCTDQLGTRVTRAPVDT